MSEFQSSTASTTTAAPDPYKHVRYSLGMVLGVDDFDQEFAYLSNRDQWLARDTIGYGTVCGLQVKKEIDAERGVRVAVEPGVAINPRGQFIRVTPEQCAYLNEWLAAHRDDVLQRLTSPLTGALTLYVVLCYRPCSTDPVPIPGEPCRDETQSTVDSRWQDDYELKFSFTAPAQTEEYAVRHFVDCVGQIEIVDTASSLSIDDFADAVRASFQLTSPLSPPTDLLCSSPLSAITINRAEAREYLRAAWRVWVTELRPEVRGTACSGSVPAEDCVLLAELDLNVVSNTIATLDDVTIDEQYRPYVVHLRMLQEWLMLQAKQDHTLGGDVTGTLEATTVEALQHVPIDPTAPHSGELLKFDGAHWTPADLSGDIEPDPTLSTDEYRVVGLRGHPINSTIDPQPDDVLTFISNEWTPHQPETPDLPNLGGDVTGPPTENTVERIRGVTVDTTLPTTDGQLLTYLGGKWTPHAPNPVNIPNLQGDVSGAITSNEVTGIVSIPVDVSQGLQPGQTLIYQEDPTNPQPKRWAPGNPSTSGNFVEHPIGLPRYSIEAAGIVRADGTVAQPEWDPVYNGLIVKTVGVSTLLVFFTTYSWPSDPNIKPTDPRHQYIVKAMPVYDPVDWKILKNQQPVVNFLRYADPTKDKLNGILLHVTDGGLPLEQNILTKLSFVIEVSRYESTVPKPGKPQQVNLNTATVDELRALPRVGPALAEQIVKTRKQLKGFATLSDVLKVPGIGEQLLGHITPFITLN